MRRLLPTLSLLLSLATLYLWTISYRFPPNRAGGDVLNISRNDPLWWIISARGRITVCRQNGRDWGPELPGFDFAGFRFGGHRGPNGSLYNLAIPHWSLAAALSLSPLLWLIHARRRRPRPGLCPRCGYDLRATPDRCPECGATPKPPSQAALNKRQIYH